MRCPQMQSYMILIMTCCRIILDLCERQATGGGHWLFHATEHWKVYTHLHALSGSTPSVFIVTTDGRCDRQQEGSCTAARLR